MSEANKAIVTRLIHDVLNSGRLDLIDELYAHELDLDLATFVIDLASLGVSRRLG